MAGGIGLILKQSSNIRALGLIITKKVALVSRLASLCLMNHSHL